MHHASQSRSAPQTRYEQAKNIYNLSILHDSRPGRLFFLIYHHWLGFGFTNYFLDCYKLNCDLNVELQHFFQNKIVLSMNECQVQRHILN